MLSNSLISILALTSAVSASPALRRRADPCQDAYKSCIAAGTTLATASTVPAQLPTFPRPPPLPRLPALVMHATPPIAILTELPASLLLALWLSSLPLLRLPALAMHATLPIATLTEPPASLLLALWLSSLPLLRLPALAMHATPPIATPVALSARRLEAHWLWSPLRPQLPLPPLLLPPPRPPVPMQPLPDQTPRRSTARPGPSTT